MKEAYPLRIRLFALLLVVSLLVGCKPDASEPEQLPEVPSVSVEQSETEAKPAVPVLPEATPLKPDETVTIEDVSAFSVLTAEITDDVVPPSAGMFYTHVPAKPGRKMVDLCFTYKNLRNGNITAGQVFSGELYASGQYRYDGKIKAEEDNRGNFAYGDSLTIIPLASEYVHCMFEIPDEIAEGDCEILAFVTVDGTVFSVTVREGGRGVLREAEAGSAVKMSDTIRTEESVLIQDLCVIRIEHAQIKKELLPFAPGRLYSRFEADDGKVYLDVCFLYRNLTGDTIDLKETVTAAMTYAGKYKYDCSAVTEKMDGSDLDRGWSIDVPALCMERVHFLFEVPEEIEKTDEPITVTFNIGTDTLTLRVR